MIKESSLRNRSSFQQRLAVLLWFVGLGLFGLSPFWLQSFYQDSAHQQNDRVLREEVLFWHFWGGQDKDVVDDVVSRFNQSQDQYFVRAIAMPGNNLQAKLFLSIAGGSPPDLVNQDDPILADWATRGIIKPLDEVASPDEVASVTEWMFPSARRLSQYEDRTYAICNGLDIRALFVNKTALAEKQLPPPESITALTQSAVTLSPPSNKLLDQYGYLPDSRRLWAWGYVFGGEFIDSSSGEITLDDPSIVQALAWMQSFSKKYGPDNVAAFRKGDQSLPGKVFPLLPIQNNEMTGRYSIVMDGQWRVRDLAAFTKQRTEQGLRAPEFGVVPLPRTPNGRQDSGWVNGNFFLIPKGAKCGAGSWEFIKFWIGYTDPAESVKTHVAGGWIPVSRTVVEHPDFQAHLKKQPLFKTFVDLAGSPNQFPIPQVPGAAYFRRRVEAAGYEAVMHPNRSPEKILSRAQKDIEAKLNRHQNTVSNRSEKR